MTGKCTLICETNLTNSGGERLSISPIGQEHVIKNELLGINVRGERTKEQKDATIELKRLNLWTEKEQIKTLL